MALCSISGHLPTGIATLWHYVPFLVTYPQVWQPKFLEPFPVTSHSAFRPSRRQSVRLHKTVQVSNCHDTRLHYFFPSNPLQWRNNGRDSVSNHQPRDCLLNRLFRLRSKKTLKLRVTGLCAGNSPGTGEFPAQMASNAEMFPFDDVIMQRPANMPSKLV